jgi:hypothetical protein
MVNSSTFSFPKPVFTPDITSKKPYPDFQDRIGENS